MLGTPRRPRTADVSAFDDVPLPEGESGVDRLTGLPRIWSFELRLGNEVARVRRHGGELALALIDLDRMDELNSRLGGPVGDRVLCAVARNLASIRGEDAAFRLGGDDFAVLFVGVGLAGARTAMRRLESAIRADEECRRIGLSYGVAELDVPDPAALVAAAGHQLVRVKRTRVRRPPAPAA